MENTINIQHISEIAKLARGLKERGIEYNMRARVDGLQIVADEWTLFVLRAHMAHSAVC